MSSKKYVWLGLVGLLMLVLSSCQPQVETVEVTRVVTETETVTEETGGGIEATGSEEDGGTPFEPGSGVKGSEGADSGWVDESGVTDAASRSESAETDLAAEEYAMDMAEVEEEAPMAEPAVGGEEADAVAEATSPPAGTAAPDRVDANSALTAGDVDDNVEWDAYLLYRRNYTGARVLDVDVSERHQINVTDANGNPLLSARVSVLANGQEVQVVRTTSNGRAYFYPKALPADLQAGSYTIEVAYGGETVSFELIPNDVQYTWDVVHPAAPAPAQQTRLDVLFLIDATGSMADEINQLKENIRAISAQIDALPSQPDVRFAMTVYRDRGDAFVSRTFEFTPDVEFFASGLAEVIADGGGDYPEDLNEGLFKAIHVPEWRVEDTVSLIFLVADAPPHLDYADQESNYAIEMAEAAERGIKIYPIASSGLDSQGEYIFRQLAQYTGGRFLFLTYGAEGAGSSGTETEFEVEDYDVTSLDGLVIKIVEEELAHRQ